MIWKKSIKNSPQLDLNAVSQLYFGCCTRALYIAGASVSNPIQLSVKEESRSVYRWTSSSGAINPMLKVLSNTNNTIKIQNPIDTKHELIIDTGTDVLH